MGRISWDEAAEISGQMGEESNHQGKRLKAKDKLQGTDIIVFSTWCGKCEFENLEPNFGPCAFCKNRYQATPTHYKRRRA